MRYTKYTELELLHSKTDYNIQYCVINTPNYNKNYISNKEKPLLQIISLNKNRTFTVQNINGLIWDTPINNCLIVNPDNRLY